jgi:hypothetical protein
MFTDEQGGEYCPACELIRVTPPPPEGHRYKTNEEYFIDGPADAVASEAKERGLLPGGARAEEPT